MSDDPNAPQDEDTTKTDGQNPPSDSQENDDNSPPLAEADPTGKALVTQDLKTRLARDEGNDPAASRLFQQFGINAQQARDILQRARDTLAQNAPQMINLAAAQKMSNPGGWGNLYASSLGAASDKQQEILKQLQEYDSASNATNLSGLNAQLKVMLARYAGDQRIVPKELQVSATPDAQPKVGTDPTSQIQRIETILSNMDPSDPQYKDYKAEIAKLTHVNDPAANAQAAAGAISPDAKEAFYQTLVATGKPPSGFTRNPAIASMMWAYAKQRADQDGNTMASMTANGNLRSANTSALTQGMKQESAISSYYDTMDKNLTALMDLSGKVDSTGSPLLNKVVRAWQQGVAGDPDVAKYVTYLNSVQSEFAKIQSGSMGNQALTDSAKKEAADTISKYLGAGTIEAVADGMRGEGNNRLSSLHDQNTYLKQQLGIKTPESAPMPGERGAVNQSSAQTPATKTPPASLLKEGVHTTFKNGQTWTLQNGQPVQVK